MWEKIEEMRGKAAAADMPVAIVAFDEEQARQRVAEGYRMIATGFDTVLLAGGIGRALAAMGRPVPNLDER